VRFRYEDLDLYVPEDERPRSGMVIVWIAAAMLVLGLVLIGISFFLAVGT
jgi:hypothetical protein